MADTRELTGPEADLSSRVLLVDDEETVLVSLAAILRQSGCQVQEASDRGSALSALAQQSFDVLVADLRLEADTDGLDILAEARRRNPSMVCIILTGFGSLDSAIEALRLGADDYLLKPCRIDDLKRTLSKRTRQHAEVQQSQSESGERGRPVSSVVHELRTPLTSIYGWAQILERQAAKSVPSAELLPGLRQISEAARTLRDAITEAATGSVPKQEAPVSPSDDASGPRPGDIGLSQWLES